MPRGRLMVALYRAGRQPEALEVFRATRSALVEAFGLEPTPALKELEARVLRQDPALDGPSPARAAPAREDRRTVLLAARDGAELDRLVAVGRCLAALGRHEVLLTQAVEDEPSLAGAVAAHAPGATSSQPAASQRARRRSSHARSIAT